jgi:hypothetical protein
MGVVLEVSRVMASSYSIERQIVGSQITFPRWLAADRRFCP